MTKISDYNALRKSDAHLYRLVRELTPAVLSMTWVGGTTTSEARREGGQRRLLVVCLLFEDLPLAKQLAANQPQIIRVPSLAWSMRQQEKKW